MKPFLNFWTMKSCGPMRIRISRCLAAGCLLFISLTCSVNSQERSTRNPESTRPNVEESDERRVSSPGRQDADARQSDRAERTAGSEKFAAQNRPEETYSASEEQEQLKDLLIQAHSISMRKDEREFRLRLLLRAMVSGRLNLSVDCPGNSRRYPFVFVPSGEFTMGRTSQDARNANLQSGGMHHSWSAPEHRVAIAGGFFIGLVEITQGDWQQFLADTATSVQKSAAVDRTEQTLVPATEEDGSTGLPSVNISWFEAVAFSQWISKKTGLPVRLPTETEWEWAARGPASFPYATKDGTLPRGLPQTQINPCGTNSVDVSWCGVRDLTGNVREWCVDLWDEELYPRRVAVPSKGRSSCYVYSPLTIGLETSDRPRVIRGGDSVNDPDANQQAATRRMKLPNTREPTLGFSLLIPLDPDQSF